MIKVEDLTKNYQGNKGIKGISFGVGEGESFGFLGPNGAGKTTTIRLLMGFIQPSSGKALINSWNCWREARRIKEVVGYLPGEISLMENITALEFLYLMIGMHGHKPGTSCRLSALAERLDINLKQSIKKMSKGMKQKVGIINAFMLDPEIYILDEPTSGLDPLMQKVLVDLLLEEKSRGKTIFISSHMFPEVERTCDRVGIIRNGELIAIEEIEKLRQTQERTFVIEIASEEDASIIQRSEIGAVSVNGRRLTLTVEGKLNHLFEVLSEVNVTEFWTKETELEEIFIQYYNKTE